MMNRRDRLKWLPNINRVIHYLREYKDVLESCGAPGDDLLMDEEITELGVIINGLEKSGIANVEMIGQRLTRKSCA